MSLVPYVIEQNSHGERSYDIYSRPVSYTHLDVYKRQIHCCLCFRDLYSIRSV